MNKVVAADVYLESVGGHGPWSVEGKLTSAISVWSTPAGEDVIFGVPVSKSVQSSLFPESSIETAHHCLYCSVLVTCFEVSTELHVSRFFKIANITKPPINHLSSNTRHVRMPSNMIHPIAIHRIPSFHRQIRIRQQNLRLLQNRRENIRNRILVRWYRDTHDCGFDSTRGKRKTG